MTKQTQLVLDVGGVLATDLDLFWEEFVHQANLPFEKVRSKYKEEIREQLWAGDISVKVFWQWIESGFPNINTAYLQTVLSRSLIEREGLHHVEKWSNVSDVHILSNHRQEWLKPLLNRLNPYIISATVSAEVGVAKPHINIYKKCMQQLDKERPILFVDNKRENLRPAENLGWHTILADSENQWIEKVDKWLL